MAQRDSPTLRSVPTSQGHTQGTQRDHTQAKEHKHEGRHWVAVAVGSQCSPGDFSKDPEEREKALSVFTGCSSAAEGVTWEKHTVADGNWHGWQDSSVSLQRKIQLMVGWSRARSRGCLQKAQALHGEGEGDGDRVGETRSHNPLTLHCQRLPGKS